MFGEGRLAGSLSRLIVLTVAGYAVQVQGIQLGDTDVPRDSFLVFLCAGNSNMSGRVAESDEEVHPHLWKYNVPCGINGEPDEGELHTWTPAQDPICGSGGGGPGMPLLKTMIAACPDYHFGIIQHSGSGSKRYTCRGQFQKGKDGYGTLVGAALRERAKVTFAGIISMLGDVEVQSSSGFSSWDHINNFAADIGSMVSSIREDLQLSPEQLPYLHTEIPYGEGLWDPATDECVVLREQIALIPSQVPASAVISSEGITLKDDHHYNYNGYLMWAARAGEALVDNGWEPGRGFVAVRPGPERSRMVDLSAGGVRIRFGERAGIGRVEYGPAWGVDGRLYTPRAAGNMAAAVVGSPAPAESMKPGRVRKE